MAIERKQICEMCGRSRVLRQNQTEDSAGWRTLDAGAIRATICRQDMALIVDHAVRREQARHGGVPGRWNGHAMVLEFHEATPEGS